MLIVAYLTQINKAPEGPRTFRSVGDNPHPGIVYKRRSSRPVVQFSAGRVSGVDMSHEAAVGKIAEEEIQYLMARGLTGEEATAAIVRGFLDVEIKGLPEHLKGEIKKAVRMGDREERLL